MVNWDMTKWSLNRGGHKSRFNFTVQEYTPKCKVHVG